MAPSPSRRASPARVRRRRRVASLIVLVALGGGAAGLVGAPRSTGTRPPERSTDAGPAAVITLRVAGTTLATLPLARYRTAGSLDPAALRRAVIEALPKTTAVRRGRARITYVYDRDRAARGALGLGRGGGSVTVSRRAVASRIAAPVIAQSQPNGCESAALSILLRSVGVTATQERLQAKLPRSGPLDPEGSGSSKVWGDPDRGYVGRVQGGGTAGGFGVYPGPVAGVARSLGVRLSNLTGQTPQAVYDRLLAGRAIMAWVGLGDGPYDTWQTPDGNSVRVNFNEHTVVLHGIDRDGTILVSNPLQGTAERWSRQKFEVMWELLDRRALST